MEAAAVPAVSSAVAPVPLADSSRRWLLFVARRALRNAMAQRNPGALDLPVGNAERPDDPCLSTPARVFVSWYDGGERVGSLGSLEPWLPLEQAVARYAVHAGLDPKLPAARASRWHRLVGEISILGAPQDLPVSGLTAIAEALVPGRDGIILTAGPRSVRPASGPLPAVGATSTSSSTSSPSRQQAVSLPSAWRQSPRARDFVVALMRTAGLSPEHDGPRLRARTFLAETFVEPVAAVMPAAVSRVAPELHLGV
ncbi:MAG TPA: AMMECR1 domain-containing protein [Nannocystis sp.]|jgi:AMMECR1 domain-containing protein